MKLALLVSFVSVVALGIAAGGCASVTDETTSASDDELRKLKPSEYVGFLQYGDEVDLAYKRSPTYRAYRLRANAFDRVTIHVTPTSPATAKVWATVLDGEGNAVATTWRDTNDAELSFEMPDSFEERTLVVREANLADADFHISVKSSGVKVPSSAFTGTSGSYAAPSAFTGEPQDVFLECLQMTRYENSAPKESRVSGVLSLDLSGKPKVVGVDGAIAAAVPDAKLDAEGASLSTSNQYANAITMRGSTGSTGSYRHLLQLTNDGATKVRVEYALESVGHTGRRFTTTSCVGLLEK